MVQTNLFKIDCLAGASIFADFRICRFKAGCTRALWREIPGEKRADEALVAGDRTIMGNSVTYLLNNSFGFSTKLLRYTAKNVA